MKKSLFFGALCAGMLLASCEKEEVGTINGLFSVSETQATCSTPNLQARFSSLLTSGKFWVAKM